MEKRKESVNAKSVEQGAEWPENPSPEQVNYTAYCPKCKKVDGVKTAIEKYGNIEIIDNWCGNCNYHWKWMQ